MFKNQHQNSSTFKRVIHQPPRSLSQEQVPRSDNPDEKLKPTKKTTTFKKTNPPKTRSKTIKEGKVGSKK